MYHNDSLTKQVSYLNKEKKKIKRGKQKMKIQQAGLDKQ